MENIYNDIATRTGGDIYVGVVGPVRTGKSTFIKKFMDTLVIPNMKDAFAKERAVDELPQSASGRTIMTTEPKFVPEKAVDVSVGDNADFRVRLIDCVGYIVPSALGYIENDQPRMVQTPWYDEAIPFNMAAELGTKKVIDEHSTVGLVLTTDGSIGEIAREEYEEAEERVVTELREINKPFIMLLNSTKPNADATKKLAENLCKKHKVTVVPVNCMGLKEEEIQKILSGILFEFPVREVKVSMPQWVLSLEKSHWLRKEIFESIKLAAKEVNKIGDIEKISSGIKNCQHVKSTQQQKIDLGKGKAKLSIMVDTELFYRILSEKTGLDIADEGKLLQSVLELAKVKEKYDKIADAYDDVLESGYGIVMPSTGELALEEPEIIKQGGKYGIRLKAKAPSVHMMQTTISTEVTPIVGSEQQSEELVNYLLKEFEENPGKIWESNILGKSLHELVNEGLHNKLYRMSLEARSKMRETIEKIINEGCNGMICIIL